MGKKRQKSTLGKKEPPAARSQTVLLEPVGLLHELALLLMLRRNVGLHGVFPDAAVVLVAACIE